MPAHLLKVEQEHARERLDVFLTQVMPGRQSRNFIKKLIDFGHVKVNEAKVKPHHKVAVGEDIFVEIPNDFLTSQHIKPEGIPLNIIYEDESLLVVDKPIGMTVHPSGGCYTGTLVNALLYYCERLSDVNGDIRPGIVHRLDKDTSGLLLVAKDNIAHTKLAKQFQRHTVRKRYVALVEGEVEFDEGKIDASLGRHPYHRKKRVVSFDQFSKKAETYYRVIKRSKGVTLISLMPRTGRTHQLRVHMAYLGHPVLGDEKYGNKCTFPRLALHAEFISFIHPCTGSPVEFTSNPPEEFFLKVE